MVFCQGAEPSSGFNFNIALHGDHEEEIGGTELAAEWSFSSLQKFGQEFLKKLKGKKMPNKLLEKVIFWFLMTEIFSRLFMRFFSIKKSLSISNEFQPTLATWPQQTHFI